MIFLEFLDLMLFNKISGREALQSITQLSLSTDDCCSFSQPFIKNK